MFISYSVSSHNKKSALKISFPDEAQKSNQKEKNRKFSIILLPLSFLLPFTYYREIPLYNMDSATGGGGGGGPAPFLLKTYEMVDDPSTNEIVSWSDAGASFVVWNPPDFASRLLPMYFKHNNFSSFIRQLNTYGFRKSDPERWEFANEHFLKGQKQLLKSIHRRKPIHSHSTPAGAAGPQGYSDRAAFEEEIDRLTRERVALQTELWRFKHQQSGARVQIQDIEHRIHDMEQRQLKMVAFLHKASANPTFMSSLIKFAETGQILPATPVATQIVPVPDGSLKKRRLPGSEMEYEVLESEGTGNQNPGFCEDYCSSSSPGFCDKLRLELCPAMAAMSTQSSNEETDNAGPHVDSGINTSLCPLKSVLVDNSDEVFPAHLDLTLASRANMEIETNNNDNFNNGMNNKSGNDEVEEREENVGPPARVNDVFWEQFLTEKPGCENEEASSNPNPSLSPKTSEREEGKDMERLKL
ncbi:hypothetical protein LUZ60_004782 [Juncus effusus]|nr:hypothetical protein LUZ60_004782 [Juncus effusus]